MTKRGDRISNKVLSARAGGKSLGEISKDLGVPRSTVQSIIRRAKEAEVAKSEDRSSRPESKLNAEMRYVIAETLRRRPATTLEALKRLCAQNGVDVSIATVSKTLTQLGFEWSHGGYGLRAPETDKSRPIRKQSKNPSTHCFQAPDCWEGLRPGSFDDLPVLETASGLGFFLRDVSVLADGLRLIQNTDPDLNFIHDYPAQESHHLLTIGRLCAVYIGELIGSSPQTGDSATWRARLLLGIEKSIDELRDAYWTLDHTQKLDAVQSLIAGLLTTAALEFGHTDVGAWQSAMEVREKAKREIRKIAGKKRGLRGADSTYVEFVLSVARECQRAMPKASNGVIANQIEDRVFEWIEEKEWPFGKRPSANVQVLTKLLKMHLDPLAAEAHPEVSEVASANCANCANGSVETPERGPFA